MHERDTHIESVRLTAITFAAAGVTIQAAGTTHQGKRRIKNEDRFGIYPDIGLCAVADGLGGHACGERAAQLALEEIAAFIRGSVINSDLPLTLKEDASRGSEANLALAVEHANRVILDEGSNNPSRRGMGTTVAALRVLGQSVFLAHVGDSRVYRFRNGMFECLTEDHSLAAEYYRSLGRPAPSAATGAANILTRCVGTKPEVAVSTRRETLAPGDFYLLCTDGLWGVVASEAIAAVLSESVDLKRATNHLIDLANNAGGPDNITVVGVSINGVSNPGRQP